MALLVAAIDADDLEAGPHGMLPELGEQRPATCRRRDGRTIELRASGHAYKVAVGRIGATWYELTLDGATRVVTVERWGAAQPDHRRRPHVPGDLHGARQ